MAIMRNIFTTCLIGLAPGCVVGIDDGSIWPWSWDPIVLDGDAGCDVDPYLGHVWYFEAEVDDWDGLGDIVAVDADVYDEWRGGRFADAFELAPTSDPGVWWGEWPERATALDCYYDGYSVDLVVWDHFDGYGVLTIRPRTL